MSLAIEWAACYNEGNPHERKDHYESDWYQRQSAQNLAFGQLLDNALEGARAAGAETKRIDLFDLDFRGCISCFACKRLGGPSYTKCAQRDALTPVLEEILAADALVVAAPIYYGEVPGAVRNFYERLLFPPNHYTGGAPDEGYGRRIRCGLIYTMGVPDQAAHEKTNYDTTARRRRTLPAFSRRHRNAQCVQRLAFDDYAKYASSGFDPVKKKAYLETEFPKECERAFQLGKRLATLN